MAGAIAKLHPYKMKPVADLRPFARNARVHSEAQVKQLAAAITEWGWTNPVLIEPDGGIIAGHGRVLAAQQLGMEKIPTITIAGLTDQQRRALVIADNKLAMNAGWDDAMLKVELLDLQSEGFAIDLIGFGAEEIGALSLEIERGETYVAGAWEGMPEFDQQNKMQFRSIVIHFADECAVDRFAVLIDQNITQKTKSTWFPAAPIEPAADKRYASDAT